MDGLSRANLGSFFRVTMVAVHFQCRRAHLRHFGRLEGRSSLNIWVWRP